MVIDAIKNYLEELYKSLNDDLEMKYAYEKQIKMLDARIDLTKQTIESTEHVLEMAKKKGGI